VGSRAGLDTEARGKILLPLPGIEPRSPSRPYVHVGLDNLEHNKGLSTLSTMRETRQFRRQIVNAYRISMLTIVKLFLLAERRVKQSQPPGLQV
jgi:hypothetical protein